MVSVPRDFTDGLLVDDRFRSERQAAARRGAANYKNLEALAQKFWKSQEPRMPEVGRKRPVLQPISTRTTANRTSRDVDSSDNISTSRQILASIPFKNRVRFASDGTPLTVASKDQKLRDRVSASHEQLPNEEHEHERLDEPMNVSTKSLISESTGTNTEEVSSNNMSSDPMATTTQTSSFSLQRQDASTLKKSLQNDGDIFLGFERKRMRTYQKKIPFYYNQPNSDDMETSRSSISESSDLSPRTVYNQRRRKINMQFTSNNGQVTVIEPYGTGTTDPRCVQEEMQKGSPADEEGDDQVLVDAEIERDSVKLKRENTVAVLKRIDVILHGPDKPPVASELGSSVREADCTESFDFSDPDVELFLPETGEDDQTPVTYSDDTMVPNRHVDSKDSHLDECTSLEDIYNEPSLFSKLDVYVKCEEWLERWF